MNKEEIATTYEEYKNGAIQVAGFGRLSCYQGLDYLYKLIEKDKYYSEQLEDSIVFIESYINIIEKQNKKYKEVIDKIRKHCEIEINASNHYLKNHSSQKELCHKVAHQRILDILKEVE